MDFKTRRISKREPGVPRKEIKKFTLSPELKAHILTIGGGIVVILVLILILLKTVLSLDFSSIIFSFGQKLQTDPTGRTNILLAGVGGIGHDGGNLTDTNMVASIDYKNKLIPMISIPRDLYVKTKQTGKSRINEVYWLANKQFGNNQGMYALEQLAGEIIGQPIQYYIKIDFSGFKKIVDALGGVDVYVEKDIYDPEYPKGETIQYETFSIKKGLQHLDGETALKYARSRHGNSGGDFGRAQRQQQLLHAIKDKALSLNILSDPGKIKALYDSVADSIDTNLTLGEIIEMAKFAKDIGKESTFSVVLNDDPTACGGYIYTPAREFFDGAAVLLPAGGSYDFIHGFVNNLFAYTPAIMQNEGIQVLNGTKTAGLAYEVMTILSQNCLNVVYYSNADNRDLEKTTIYYQAGTQGEKPQILDLLTKMIPAQVIEGIPPNYLTTEQRQKAKIVIELGKDYLPRQLPNPFDSLKYLYAPSTGTEQSTQQAGTTATPPASSSTKPTK